MHALGSNLPACASRARSSRQTRRCVPVFRATLVYRLEKGDPGLALGQVLRYLEAIAPGSTLLALLSEQDPALLALAAREKTQRVRDMSAAELKGNSISERTTRMTAKELKLMVFAHLGQAWAPCGQLLLTEEGTNVLASSFAYGLNYPRRADALEVDPVSLSLRTVSRSWASGCGRPMACRSSAASATQRPTPGAGGSSKPS